MRVKKLNVARRPKAGEDEAAGGIAAGEDDSEQRKWVSPTKSLRGGGAASSSNSGASSPTDAQPQDLSKHLLLQFETIESSSELLGRGAGGVAVMPKTAAVAGDVEMGEEEAEKADHKPMRKAMVATLIETLRAMKPQAPEKVLAGLPRLAEHMEEALFKLAKNKVEYSDHTTLRSRIGQIQKTSAKRLLAQQHQVQQQQQQQAPEHRSSGNKAVPALMPLTEEQAGVVFQHLQSWRQRLVHEHAVAPWDILPNSTLAKVALYMPSSEAELALCGVGTDRMTRFGASLIQTLQRLRGSTDRVDELVKAKSNIGKRSSSESTAGHSSKKKQKDGAVARPASMASSKNGLSSSVHASLLPIADSLPTLLPMVSMRPEGGGTNSTTTLSRSMPTTTQSHCTAPAAPRAQTLAQQSSACPALENHMHLLVQGAGQLSKQPHVKSLETYEQEVQSLRWMLHQSQQEKAQLEREIQRLRAELHDATNSK